MISGLLKKIFGSRNDRLIKQYSQVVRKINALEAGISALSDEALRGKTAEFKARVGQWRDAGCAAAGGFRRRSRGRQAYAWACATSMSS
jgi:preprotein translocase subunit SecA